MKEKTYNHLQPYERDLAALRGTQGCSQEAIAAELGRSTSTISRELKRNSLLGQQHYMVVVTDTLAERRRIPQRERKLDNLTV